MATWGGGGWGRVVNLSKPLKSQYHLNALLVFVSYGLQPSSCSILHSHPLSKPQTHASFPQVKERHGGLSSAQVAVQGKRKLIWAPCLFVLLRIWGTIRFLQFCIYIDQPNEINDSHKIDKILIVCHVSRNQFTL